MNAPLTYSVECPRAGLTVTLERDTTATNPWTASIALDIGGVLPLSLNRCGNSPWEACWRLHEAINAATDTLSALDLSGQREHVDRLNRLWHDTLDPDLSHID